MGKQIIGTKAIGEATAMERVVAEIDYHLKSDTVDPVDTEWTTWVPTPYAELRDAEFGVGEILVTVPAEIEGGSPWHLCPDVGRGQVVFGGEAPNCVSSVTGTAEAEVIAVVLIHESNYEESTVRVSVREER